jgi:hypothetical protein
VTIQATQEGNADFRPAASEQKTIQILPAPVTVEIAPSSTRVTVPGMVSVSVPVSWSGSGAVSGTVELYDGRSEIGTATLDATGVATFGDLQLSLGVHTLAARFSQQGNFAAGSSAAVDISVVYPPSNLQMIASSTGALISAGQQAIFSVSIEPSLGFTPNTTFSCDGLPALSTCEFSQNPMSIGATGGTVTVKISTTGPNQGQVSSVISNFLKMHSQDFPLALAGTLWIEQIPVMLLVCFTKRHPRGRNKRGARTIALFILSMIPATLLSGCGRAAPSTQAGTSQVKVNAVAVQGATSVTQNVYFLLEVTK